MYGVDGVGGGRSVLRVFRVWLGRAVQELYSRFLIGEVGFRALVAVVLAGRRSASRDARIRAAFSFMLLFLAIVVGDSGLRSSSWVVRGVPNAGRALGLRGLS